MIMNILKGIVTFDIYKFGKQDWENGNLRSATCLVKSKQKDENIQQKL